MITALNVANTFLKVGKEDRISITPMKLQKLIFILYKEYLKSTNRNLFSEKFETWKYGPVLPSVYSVFKEYGGGHITKYYYNSDDTYSTVTLKKGTDFYEVFYDVWNKYKNLDGRQLSNLTHQENTAWYKAVKNKNPILINEDIYNEQEYEI